MSVTISGMRSTSIFPVSNGGTGQPELTSGSILIGNGTNPITGVAPGSNGQVLTIVSGAWAAADADGGLSTVNTAGNLDGDGSINDPVTLKANISLTSVTASFTGSGAGLTNIPNNALQNSSITINGTTVPLGGSYTIIQAQGSSVTIDGTVTNYENITGIPAYSVVALSGTLVRADNSDNLKSNAIGIVTNIDGTTVTVKHFGESNFITGSQVTGVGTPVFVGPTGSVVPYSALTAGKFVTQVGYISPNSNKIVIQIKTFGQL